MRRRDRQRAAIGFAQLGRSAADVLHLPQDARGPGNDLLAGRRCARQRAAFAFEQMKAEFFLEQFQLPADAGLRGVQLPGGGSDIETILVDCYEVAQLLKLHRPPGLMLIDFFCGKDTTVPQRDLLRNGII